MSHSDHIHWGFDFAYLRNYEFVNKTWNLTPFDKKEENMATRREVLERQIANAADELARLENLNLERLHDIAEPGRVVSFDKVMGGIAYSYAFICFESSVEMWHPDHGTYTSTKLRWAGTGPKAPKYFTTDELIKWLTEGVEDIWIATLWERL